MASITYLALIAVAAGIVLAFKFARGSRYSGATKFFGSALTAVFLGFGLSFAAGVSNALCVALVKACAPTVDTTVFHMAFPLLAVPLYWVVMLLTPRECLKKSTDHALGR